jgi:acylglycerol lipase
MAPVVLDPEQSGSIARTFAADGYDLRYRSWSSTIGESRGVIVLLNGIMSHSLWFFPLAKPLREAGFKLVGADRRGSGANEAARGDAPSSKVLIDDACRIIERERLSDRPLYLVGWCWGAVLAMNLAAELSGRIDGLALLAPGLFPTVELKRRMAEQEPLARGQPESAPCLESPISEGMFTSGPFLDDFIVKDEHRLARFTPRFLAAMGKLGMGARLALPKLALPILLVLAERDRATDNTETERGFEKAKAARVTRVRLESAHGMQFDVPEALARSIVEWTEGRTA